MKKIKLYVIIAKSKQEFERMIRLTYFVVIEDDIKTQDSIKKVLRKAIISKDNNIQTLYFTKYNKELKHIIEDTAFRKVYIMDIELASKKNGIEIAKEIRMHDWESEIIFITCHDNMFETVYRNVYEVFDFIEKFFDMEKRLEEDIKLIFQKNFDNKMFKITSRNIDLQIYYRAITYILRDKEERKVIIHTDSNIFKISMNLTNIEDYLDDRFIKVHRSCIVNHQRVHQWMWPNNSFMLDNGEKIPYLSRKYKKEVEKIC